MAWQPHLVMAGLVPGHPDNRVLCGPHPALPACGGGQGGGRDKPGDDATSLPLPFLAKL